MEFNDSFPGSDKQQQAITDSCGDLLPISCTLCNNPPRNVVESECCGALYCWECVFKTETCVCDEELSPERCREAKAIEKLLASSRKKEAPKIETVPCPEGCGENYLPAELEEHIRTVCPRAQIACECMTKLRRGELVEHMQTECPLAIVDCPFGCVDVLMRRDMEEHLDENRDAHMEGMLKQLKEQRELIHRLLAQNQPAPSPAEAPSRKPIWCFVAMVVCFLMWPQAVIVVGLLYFCIDRLAKDRAAKRALNIGENPSPQQRPPPAASGAVSSLDQLTSY